MTTRLPSAHRDYVGSADEYDIVGGLQFALLLVLGLRSSHRVIDVGCGALSLGRLLIPYLDADRYCGVEPNRWLVETAVAREVGDDAVRLRRARFSTDDSFELRDFEETFDFVVAHSILTHTSQAQMQTLLASAATRLAPEGLVVATYAAGLADDSDDEWRYPAASHFRPETVDEAARRAGLTLHDVDWPHPQGQEWIVLSRPTHTPPRVACPREGDWSGDRRAERRRRFGLSAPGDA